MATRGPHRLPLGPEGRLLLLRHLIGSGPGGLLLVLWSVGAGLFLIIHQALLALAWTGVCSFLGLCMVYTYLSSSGAWARFLQACLAEQLSWKNISVTTLQETVQKSSEVLVEIAVRLRGLGGDGQARQELSRVLDAASELFAQQVELAREVESLEQGLTAFSPDQPMGIDLITEAPTVRHEALEELQRQASRGLALVGEMEQQQETLLLQVLRLETNPDPKRGTAELAREVEATLARARAKVQELHQAQWLPEGGQIPPDLRSVRSSLRQGFSGRGSCPGLKALQQLEDEYLQTRLVLSGWDDSGSLSLAPISHLAEETYRQGMGVLRRALALLETIRSSDRDRLESEAAELADKIASFKVEGGQEPRARIMEETLASHLERLGLLDQQESQFQVLVHQCGRCEASLHRTRMQLAELRSTSSELSIGAVTDTLRRAIDQARKVQEELMELGF